MKPPLEHIIPANESGAPLLDALMRAFPSYKPDDWLTAAATGHLLANDAPVDFNAAPVALPGTRITFHAPARSEPKVDDSYAIVFEDEHIAVVDKPGNLPCHPAGRYYENSLSRLLAPREVHMVNRLDRETSGLVLAAKTPAAASRCGLDLMAGRFAKTYLVIVAGCWTLPREHTANGVIRLERGEIVRKKRVFDFSGDGQPCSTVFRLIKTDPAESLSLLEADPITGRPHQIRATLKTLGYPVAGDKLYGPDETIYARLCADALTPGDIAALGGFTRQCLHSWRLGFPHPFTRGALAFEAPP
ncbi:MAG: RluA family pseudouridine synthase, partial [Kiritimatiellaeota bacterium]|nr:RluA family pseudouridine synthase [Kiritimatiellota bacterium]